MKKIILLVALGLTSMAAMAEEVGVCTGTTSGVGIAKTDTSFIKSSFTPTCSIDTLVTVNMDQVKLWGASASLKGKKYFAGSTNGGAIKPVADCAASTGCTAATDIAAGMIVAAELGEP